MKKIIYSDYIKIAIVVLFIMSVVSAALSAVWGVGRYTEEDENVYAFESDFS